ncbi:hypothetical protein HMI54_015715 [Coelomomyces lativittatus]|nr:hypothetical protein HMI56_006841 [Coelomomyces lativittatus]KAJ1510135.1 hypothetical protein HMI55_007108 [Coelomomyces lativittatus]KAJ1512426.1 hypothetical protein HMI54_015715 [Coelomomyces lativittatus]
MDDIAMEDPPTSFTNNSHPVYVNHRPELMSNTSSYLNDLKNYILKMLPQDNHNLELNDPEMIFDVPDEVALYTHIFLGTQPTPRSKKNTYYLTPGYAMYLYTFFKYQSSHKLSHPQHLPYLQILVRYQNPSFGFLTASKPKSFDASQYFLHERPLFSALAIHFRDPTDFIAFFRHFPVLYFGHYLLRSMVAYTRFYRDICNQGHRPPSLIILWDGDNMHMPEDFLILLKKDWIQLHVHVLVQGQHEWEFITQLPNAQLHISHISMKEAVDYQILEQIAVNLKKYKNQSLLIVSNDRSFEIMAELARDKLKTWIYRARKINLVIFLLHWIELHISQCILKPKEEDPFTHENEVNM